MRFLRLSSVIGGTVFVLSLTLFSTLAWAQTPEPRRYWTVPSDVPLMTAMQIEVSPTVAMSYTLGEGYLFLSPHEKRVNRSPYDPTLLMVDNDGELVYYKQADGLSDHSRFDDFKLLDNGLLVSWVGGVRNHQFQDSSYNVVQNVKAVGINSDLHDIILLPNGNYMLMIYRGRTIDVSDLVEGGATDLRYIDCNLQEIDADGNMVFEWRSDQHYAITDTYNSLVGRASIDGPHCNSVELDTDGNLLISSRDNYEVTKISRETGEIIWRLGGKNNQFEFINAIDAEHVTFEKQHDARLMENGNLTLYDNRTETYSRVVEYEIDDENMTATLVWAFRLTPDGFGAILGNAQRLPNGNTLVSWGNAPRTLVEVSPDGDLLGEWRLPIEMVTYRGYRFPWQGYPTTSPELMVVREIVTDSLTLDDANTISTTSGIRLAYSWNGATEVITYNVYADTSAFPETLLDVQVKAGFETITTITDTNLITDMLNGEVNFRVVPLDASGEPFTKAISGTNQSAVISSSVQSIVDALVITVTPTIEPTVEPTIEPTPTPEEPTPEPTATVEATAAVDPTAAVQTTSTPAETATETPTSTSTPTPVPTETLTPTATPTATLTPTATQTPTPTPIRAYLPGVFQEP